MTNHLMPTHSMLIVQIKVDDDLTGTFGPFATSEERDTWIIRKMLDWPNAIFVEDSMDHPDEV